MSCSRQLPATWTSTTSERHILDAPGVIDCHDLHAWTITSGMNVLSAHVVLEAGADPALALDELSRCLADDFDIEHSTFQIETADRAASRSAVTPDFRAWEPS